MKRILLLAAALLLPSALHSQGGMLLAPGTQADFSARTLAGDSVQLQAIFIWRGRPGWDQMSNAEYAVGKRMVDSVVRDARSKGRNVDGTITPRGEALMIIDHDSSLVFVKGVRHSVPKRDSVLVIVLDRADGVGGPTTVEHFTLAWAPDRNPAGESMAAQETLMKAWRDRSVVEPRVRAFLGVASDSTASGSAPKRKE